MPTGTESAQELSKWDETCERARLHQHHTSPASFFGLVARQGARRTQAAHHLE